MKQELYEIIENQKEEIINFADELFKNPELGYKEHKTKQLILEKLKQHNIKVEKEYFETGFHVSIGNGKNHIGLIAELDAIPTLNHPYSNPIDNAAHACGHNSQVAVMVNSIIALKKYNKLNDTKITLFFTPAEEYTDLEYRKQLIKENKIKYIGGKCNMLESDIFNDVDCIIHLHAMGNNYKYGYGSTLAGFIYKKITFKGKTSHAGVLPHLGINALNMFTLFNTGLGMLRETFKEEDMIRVHGILTKGGDSINSIPSETIYECYIRCLNYTSLKDISDKIDTLATHTSKALQGDVEIINENGYLPFTPNQKLSLIAYENILNFANEDEIIKNEKSIAAGDIGDVSCFYPTIQFGYNGFKGSIHGKDFDIKDKYKSYIEPSKIVVGIIYDLIQDKNKIEEIKKSFKQTMSKEEYIKYLEN